MDAKPFRRDVLKRAATLGVFAAVSSAACGKEKHVLRCTDTTGLAPGDLALRESPAVAYADIAVDPGKPCNRCLQFVPSPSPDACGSCKVIKGPVNPNGGCRLFVVKPA